MIASIFYILLALLGIGFLIFIHELGHYFMAKRAGITVLAFAIGFGKPIIEWERNGVKWKIGCLPFGGYVKMDGMEKQGAIEPYQIPGGFFAAKPWNRIKVAFAGPFVNILFALFAFTLLWFMGGRDKPFAAFTHHIGWVESDSGLYEANIRPGDEITKLNGRPYTGYTDFLYATMLDKSALKIDGLEADFWNGTKSPFNYTFPPDKNLSSISPAQYVLYDKLPGGAPNELPAGSSLIGSGITYGDRILWVDGELIFSLQQLVQVVNSTKVLLTVERGGETFLTRVPRLSISDLRLTAAEKEELDDWRYEAKLQPKVDQLAFIPYNLKSNNIVENALGYIDEKSHSQNAFEGAKRSHTEIPLQPGDKIVAIQGQKITSSYQLLKELQSKKCLIVVQKTKDASPPSWKEADLNFESSFEIADLQKIVSTVGTDSVLAEAGDLRLLKPVTPAPMREVPQPVKKKLAKEKKGAKSKVEATHSEEAFKETQLNQITAILPTLNRLTLGVYPQDKVVVYNPNPFVLFEGVFKETYRTLFALVTGFVSPKHLVGPVGIVQVIHYSWSIGAKEALFWLGMISLNLGLMNLLPIPVLDGGYIVLAGWEAVTKKPLKAKTLERLIFPFIILLVGLFVYLTYNDLIRLFTSLFN